MADNEDIKAKMREAMERKQPHDAVDHEEHKKEHGPQTQGPKGGEKMFRRKSGG